ncbi:transducin beta-like protein 2 isoform X2 [Dendronephthya gigantea]|uniref:transducin beta-like protein 2 isoform X2 n=1 Tax=Dendronephthya gigantea TaxID=151771 RepID=UPI00106A3110|nr:transducin beta-like protein 2 isoform X2 [Dendronephthya gigantea]
MADEEESLGIVQFTVILLVTVVFGGFLVYLVFSIGGKKGKKDASNDSRSETKVEDLKAENNTAESSKVSKKAPTKNSKRVAASEHPKQLCILKGHTSDVLYIEFTNNGKLLGSTSSDRTIRLWSVKDFNERDHKYIRGNVEWDHATKINLTQDARAFISALANGNTIRVFKVQKKHDGTGNTVTGEFDFPQQHKADIINVGVSATGKFIMSCSNDTTIVIWNLKGEVLETLNTNQVNNSFACISPCGRFVASAGFTSDVKLYEVEFTKTGDFKQVSRAMDLKGHSAGVYHFSFSADCTRMATVSKDGTWKIWDIDVEYNKGQDPSLLMTGVYSGHHNNMFIAISPDAYVVAISMGRSIGVFNTTTGELEEMLENVHSDDISSLTWHPSCHFFASAGGADKHIRVWHNTAGIKAQIHDLEGQLKKAKTESLKTRLEHRILEARSTLEKISF